MGSLRDCLDFQRICQIKIATYGEIWNAISRLKIYEDKEPFRTIEILISEIMKKEQKDLAHHEKIEKDLRN